jgi:hypothetical protein
MFGPVATIKQVRDRPADLVVAVCPVRVGRGQPSALQPLSRTVERCSEHVVERDDDPPGR